MSQAADNPDQADNADLPHAGAGGMPCDARALPDLPAESAATDALMALPEPDQSEAHAILNGPSIARDSLSDTLEQIATTLKSLDDRVSRLEVQPQLRGATRRLVLPARTCPCAL